MLVPIRMGTNEAAGRPETKRNVCHCSLSTISARPSGNAESTQQNNLKEMTEAQRARKATWQQAQYKAQMRKSLASRLALVTKKKNKKTNLGKLIY